MFPSIFIVSCHYLNSLGMSDAQDEVLFASSDSGIFSNSKGLSEDGVLGAERDVFGFHQITFDTADVTVQNSLNEDIAVWLQSTECYKVLFFRRCNLCRESKKRSF